MCDLVSCTAVRKSVNGISMLLTALFLVLTGYVTLSQARATLQRAFPLDAL